jgi:hypothetical protein
MSELDFLLNQSNWDEIIFKNEYDCCKELIKYEYNDFSINGMFKIVEEEYQLLQKKFMYTLYTTYIEELNMDIIDKISLKIKLNNPIDKLLLFGFYIRIQTQSRKEIVNLLDTNLLDSSLLSYLNNHHIEENDNIIIIPLIQFNILEHGYLYKKLNKKIIRIFFENTIKLYESMIQDVSIVFNGRKYYDFDSLIKLSKEIYYKPIDIKWDVYNYPNDGIKIKDMDTKCKFIIIKLIKHDDNYNYDEFINNQPNIEEITFEYNSHKIHTYNLKYMQQVVLFDVNIYILPFYPEFTNLSNIVYYLKNSENGIELYNEYIIKIKTNIVNEKYNIYISSIGEWVS